MLFHTDKYISHYFIFSIFKLLQMILKYEFKKILYLFIIYNIYNIFFSNY